MQPEELATFAIALFPLPQAMTVPLWGLIIFMVWTIVVVVLLLIVRIRHLAAGGSPKDFGVIDDNNLMWRLFRVQANLVENLPLYLGVVLLLTLRGISGTAVDIFISIYITFRMIHSIIHILGLDPRLRILSLMIQFSCLLSLISLSML